MAGHAAPPQFLPPGQRRPPSAPVAGGGTVCSSGGAAPSWALPGHRGTPGLVPQFQLSLRGHPRQKAREEPASGVVLCRAVLPPSVPLLTRQPFPAPHPWSPPGVPLSGVPVAHPSKAVLGAPRSELPDQGSACGQGSRLSPRDPPGSAARWLRSASSSWPPPAVAATKWLRREAWPRWPGGHV